MDIYIYTYIYIYICIYIKPKAELWVKRAVSEGK